MNERIKELAEQVGFGPAWFEQAPPGHPTLPKEGMLKEFAELIVKDCMALCDELKVEYFNHRKGTMDFDEKHIYAEGEAACFNLRFKMKKQFGVEE